jgi:2-succinyl-6-hydroxy-2,4-cyclohexadiene-1-carboxylate synthase
MTASESRFIEADGLRLHAVLDHGPVTAASARPVVLLHGFTGSAESMAGVVAPLAADRSVVRLELVGHGESEAPEDVTRYAMGACALQILAATRNLGLDRPHLLGYSMGGRAALYTALECPEAFASLTLVGATAGIADPVARAERVQADRVLAARIETGGLEAFVDYWMALPIFASQARRLPPGALARARAERLRQRPHGLANSLLGMGAGAQPPVFDRLDRFIAPALLVVGEEDVKFREIARVLARGMTAAHVTHLPEAGHAVHLEQPAAFVERVRAFLGDVDAKQVSGSRAPDGKRRANDG